LSKTNTRFFLFGRYYYIRVVKTNNSFDYSKILAYVAFTFDHTSKQMSKKFTFLPYIICLALSLSSQIMLAQAPVNDECTGATDILNVQNQCVTFNTTNATVSSLGAPICFSPNGRDVWFSFIAIATDVRISIANATGAATPSPQGAIYYTEDCMQFQELLCRSSTSGTLELYKGGLYPGLRYYIRVQAANAATASFRLCINNYNPPASSASDCTQGAVLCDKSPFAVQSVTGAGTSNAELQDATCFFTDGVSNFPRTSIAESNSTWFRWTCQTTGPLTFTLTPLVITDDIDFALYEMPNGVDDCTGKTLVRCMAAGPSDQGNPNPTANDRRCFGATGVGNGATDDSEPAGCLSAVGHDNFVRTLDMVAGRSYALCVNNFSSGGNGFSIDFGNEPNTGTFVGPNAAIATNKPNKRICLGEDIQFTDASTFANGQIVKWNWRFGKDASLDTASGRGPFNIYYKTPGWKAIVLSITTNRGCIVTKILDSVYVKPFEYDTFLRPPTCSGGNDGAIRLTVTSCGRPPIRYNWENTGYTTRDSISRLARGTYRVAVTDASGVYVDTLRFTIRELEVTLDTAVRAVQNPRCFGRADGLIQLAPATGKPPYLYNFFDGTGLGFQSSRGGLRAGRYNVLVVDSNQCKGNFTFDIIEPPKVEVSIDTINISCYGRSDGSARAYPSGGVGGFQFNWSNGDTRAAPDRLAAGSYNVTVADANGCEGAATVRVSEPPQLFATPGNIRQTICYGDSSGRLIVNGLGGTPPYRYSIDGVRFQRDSVFDSIPARAYVVTVRDSTGCKQAVSVEVPSAPILQVSLGSDVDIDLGFSTSLRAIVVPSSRLVSYVWTPKDSTLSCVTCPNVIAAPVRTTLYRVAVRDSSGCRAFDDILVRVIKKRPIFIPNVFSPNYDGINDRFTLFGNQAAVKIKVFKIFNRWGDMVFSTQNIRLDDPTVGWDGTFAGSPLTPDVFTFFAVVSFVDGEDVEYTGDVTIMK
jgi:gliding motility-associated-like protein